MKFLLIINISPLDSCTYLGLDQGGQPCQVTHILYLTFTEKLPPLIARLLRLNAAQYSTLFLMNFQLAFVWDILLLMAKNVSEPDFISGDRSMSFGRKNLVDGSIAETRRNMSQRDTSQESRFFMKQARKILWRELRGTPLKAGEYPLIFAFASMMKKLVLGTQLMKFNYDLL